MFISIHKNEHVSYVSQNLDVCTSERGKFRQNNTGFLLSLAGWVLCERTQGIASCKWLLVHGGMRVLSKVWIMANVIVASCQMTALWVIGVQKISYCMVLL